MKWQGFVELMLFLAVAIGAWLATYELLFPSKTKTQPPTTDKEDDG